MAKKLYLGVNEVARKGKKMYFGVADVARKVKKGYIGIGGVARPFWTGGELGYYGAITPLSEVRDMLAGTSVGNYALFGGGRTQSMSAYSSKVDAYNRSLVRSSPTALSKARMLIAAGSIGNYALFAGGCTTTTDSQTTVEAYNLSLTRTSPTALSVARHQAMQASTQVHAIFAGGSNGTYDDTEGYSRSAVDAYNASLTRSTTKLGSAGGGIGASVGEKALFVTQYRIDVFDTSLTRMQASWPSWTPSASANVKDYAILAGGVNGAGYCADAYAYDASLTRTTLTNLSVARATVGASVEGYAIFAGGKITTSSFEDQSSTVDVYDEKLTRKTQPSLSVGKNNHASATVGDYALFGGGRGMSNTAYDSVDAYVVG